jgi:type II secretory pathway component PulM
VSRAWRSAWNSRTPGERAGVSLVAVLVGIALYFAFVYVLDRSRSEMRANVGTLRGQAAALERHAAEIERLRAVSAPVTPPRPRELRALVDAEARAAGLSSSQVRVDARSADEIQVVLGSAPFAAWLAWVASLQAREVRLETCRIEPLSTPGLVSVTATFINAGKR